ncbi:MAG TPA: flagellar basal body P-ring formation chaperone FlgA [bacterium]|nr:flagellar basal body P-ring formation chaperone FlgA [bacterium]HPN43212.1 flagellar basal body P-ring formation chaperone FlgA [bacterium]
MQRLALKNLFSTLLLITVISSGANYPVPVSAQENSLNKDQLGALLLEYVNAQSGPNETAQIHITSMPSKMPAGAGDWRVSCRKPEAISGKTVFTLTLNGDREKICQVVADVKKIVPVLIINKRVDRHHIIQHTDLEPATREMTWPKSEYAIDIENALGKRTTRQITSGRVLTSSMVEEIPVVERGENLSMTVVDKNLYVEIPVISQGQGYRGDIIQVRNATTNAYYLAEIIDENTVIYKSTKR